MATVYLAHDLKHDRDVALKVLRPELAAVLGSERFLREIQLTAKLQHPHIVTLIESGEVLVEHPERSEGPRSFMYYVLPYVEGESLRERLTREGPLPLDEVHRITRAVAGALQYAHDQGVIHRDIKPENILISQGEPVVADFGIALAAASAGRERITETGLSLGTPTYMSPEQATAEPRIDGRSDQYSLACVVYEMLAGEPPYTGASAQAIIAKRLSEPVPHVGTLRAVPPAVEGAVSRALAKSPADRFASVAEFASALSQAVSSLSTGSAKTPTVQAEAPRTRSLHRAVVAGVVLVGVAAAFWSWRRDAATPHGESNLIAVFPFRVAGADPAVQYLHEGMIDLLAAKLTGDGGPRAVDPASVMSAWRKSVRSTDEDLPVDVTLRLAQRLGADHAVLGAIVGTSARLMLSAKVLDAPTGRSLAQVEVTGTADSLPVLIDRLSAQLLARAAGQTEQRLTDLTSTSLPAVRAYLNGQAAYRQGRYAEATEQYGRALDLDSTFALAAVGLAATGYWSGEPSQRAVALSWAGRDRLNFRDRALAIAFAGPRFPAETPLGERRLAWEKAVKVAPDRPEAWFFLGDWYFHFGALTGFAGSDERASACFRRALELDPQGEAPLAHLVELAAFRGDSSEAGRLAELFLAADSAGDVADFIRWRVAVARDDSAVLDRLRARFDGMATGSLVRIVQASQESGVALGDADHAAEVLRGRVGTVEESLILAALALNRGRPATHSRMIAALRDPAQAERDHLSLRVQVASALFGDGDTTTATRAFTELARHAGASLASDSAARDQQILDICLVELWRLGHHEMGSVDQAIHRLMTPAGAGDSAEPSVAGATCALILEAVLASNRRGADAVQVFDRLDSILVAGVLPPYPIPANLILAQVRSSLDPRRALDAVRRRGRWTTVPLDDYLSTYLREEGRLAALAGDREGAVRAYQHYLALRSTPEPTLAPQVSQVRDALANLIREPR